jgi:hypothetical protein
MPPGDKKIQTQPNPNQTENKAQCGAICQRLLFEELSKWPTTSFPFWFLLTQRKSYLTISAFSGWPFSVIQEGEENSGV